MDIWVVLLDVVILLGAGALLGGLSQRLGQSAILGYVLAGVLLGPNVLHVIRSKEEVLALSELGVALLLFAIGLEFSWSRLRGMGRVALGSGIVQVLGTAAVGAGIAAVAGFGLSASLVLGAMGALSSTASVLRVLATRGEIETIHGERALGILLVQDMAVVPFVLIASVLAEGGTAGAIVWGVLRTAGIGLVLVGVLYVVFHRVVPWLLASAPIRSNRELPLLVAVVSGIGSGVAAHAAGVSPALGAFVAGVLLGGSPFAVQVRADVSSLKTLLLTLFFAAMGMLADPAWIASNALLVGAVVGAVMIGKAILVWGALRLFEARGRTALATGLCLAQVGEFSFVLADIARGRLLNEWMFLLVVSTTVITMLLTPYLVAGATRLAARAGRRRVAPELAPGKAAADAISSIVVGFGPAGRTAAERIAELGCHVVVVDQNPAAARDARSRGYGAVTGDACHAEVLDHAGLPQAAFVVVTVPVTDTALQLVRYVRSHAPESRIVVRARFHSALPALQAAGAHAVIDEEREIGRLIATAYEDVLRRSGEAPKA